MLAAVNLFTPEDSRRHLTPIAISLLLDKVAAVRQVALSLVSRFALLSRIVSTLSSQLVPLYHRRQILDMVYLSTAIGYTPGGGGTVHIYTQTIHRTTQIITTTQ